MPTAQGTRPLLVEVQALVAPAVYGAARRGVSGLDATRLGILLAVLALYAAPIAAGAAATAAWPIASRVWGLMKGEGASSNSFW